MPFRFPARRTVWQFGIPYSMSVPDRAGPWIEFNLRTRTISRTFSVGGVPQKVDLSPDGNTLYIANQAGYVQFWNPHDRSADRLEPSAAGRRWIWDRPQSSERTVVRQHRGRRRNIHIINPTTRTVLKSITVGASTRRVVFNASGSVGFVANEAGWVDFLK